MIDVPSISSGLNLGTNGVWYATEQQSVSYPANGNEACFQIEDSSFWFKHRNACIVTAVRNYPPQNGDVIFDIGGGNGFVSLGLMEAGFSVAVIEPGPLGAANAKKRRIPTVICATTDGTNIKSSALGAVGLFDVIEHMENDVVFLKSIRNLVKPGGRLYATVPAYSLLWSEEDDLAGHFRRYTSKSICRSIASAGFDIEFASYIFAPLPIPIFLFRSLPYRLRVTRMSGGSIESQDHTIKGGLAGRMLSWILDKEIANIATNKPMQFGGSCLVVARAT
jgi:2-polyprenyl-3-methyl-5-hydroxy-6-metoxy-1,4-benzoquinol methylase